jgi:hypothetical protein
MTILPPPRLLLHQVRLSLRPQKRPHLHQLHLHPRQSPQTVLSPKAMTLRLRLPRLRLQLLPLPRPNHLLRLPLPKPVTVAAAAMCIREASTYLGVCSF